MKKFISLLLVICIMSGSMFGCSLKRISMEEDILNMQIGGYLYTSSLRADTKDEREFLRTRAKAVDEMISNIEKSAKDSFDVNNGLEKYENNLIKYMEKIKTPDSNDSAIINGILEKITAYKIINETYEEETRQYMKMKPSGEVEKAIINTYMFDSICKLVNSQNEYISWIINNTSSIAAILEKTSEKQADRLISSAVTIYIKQIQGDLFEMLEQFENASVINSAILSADYYVASKYLEMASRNIDILKSGETEFDVSDEELSDLDQLFNDAKNPIAPPVLKPLPKKETSLSFTKKVYAEESALPAFNLSTALLEFYFNPVPWILQAESQEALTKQIEEKKSTVEANPEKMNSTVEEKPLPHVTLSDDVKTTTDIAKEASKNRSTIILGIKIGQGYIKFMTRNSPNQVQERYEKIIEKISNMLANNNSSLSDKERQAAVNLIESNIEKLIGNNKEQFVNLILNDKAESLYDAFANWKDSIENIGEHVFTKDDLITLLTIMGIDVSPEVPDDIVAETPSNTPTTMPSPSPTASQTDSPVNSSEPSNTVSPSEPDDPMEIYNITEIIASWSTLRLMDPTISNEAALQNIYGWIDLLDYSQYERREVLDNNGNPNKVIYLDDDLDVFGWEIWYGDGYIGYSYHFFNDRDYDLEIIRNGPLDNSYIYQISTENEIEGKMTTIRFNPPDREESDENLVYIIQKHNKIRNGLNTTSFNGLPTYAIYKDGEILDSYTFKNNIMIRELSTKSTSSGIEASIKEYYDSGKIKFEYKTLDGKRHGNFITYYEEGGTKSIIEFNNGTVVN